MTPSSKEREMKDQRRRVFASMLGSLLVGTVFAVAPNVAGAQDESSGGYVEICKTFTAGAAGAPQYQGTFTYDINDSSDTTTTVTLDAVEGGDQACTSPVLVAAGTATVTEEQASWFSVSGISASPGDPGTVTPSSTDPYTATVTVNPAPSPGDESMTTTVQYSNEPVTGTIEVCKQADPNSPNLTGTYTFNVTSTEAGVSAFDSSTGAYDLPWTTTASATISASGLGCSGPILVPAGSVQTVEPGTTYVTNITASSNGTDELMDSDLADGTADVSVPASDTTNQTIVTYTDALSAVKLCKAWTGSDQPSTAFPFSLSSSGPGGPTAVSSSVTLGAGNCRIVGYVRAGTQVNITEGIVAGTKVASIGVSPQTNSQDMSPIVPGSLSLPNGTVSVVAGAGETVVTYTDELANPGQLKICVAPTSSPAAGTVPFLVNGSEMLDVNLSSTAIQCTLDPTTYGFNSSVTISGGALPSPDAYAGTASVVPTSLEVLEGGVPTATDQATLVSGSASSATVLMSEGIVTEVTFTVDPPAPAIAPTHTATPSAAQVASASADLPASGPATKGTVSPAVVSSVIRKQVSHVRTEIRSLEKRLASKHLSKAVRRADRKNLTALRRLLPKLLRELG
jgi:hypothetical protein